MANIECLLHAKCCERWFFIYLKNLILPKPYESYNHYPRVQVKRQRRNMIYVNLPKVEQLENGQHRMKLRQLCL